MSWRSRIVNVFRPDRLNREIEEELQSHLDEAVEEGRDPEETRRAFGAALRIREESRDARVLVWLDSLRAIAPDNATEIAALEADAGRHIGYVRVVGRRRADALVSDPVVSIPSQYEKKPLLRGN